MSKDSRHSAKIEMSHHNHDDFIELSKSEFPGESLSVGKYLTRRIQNEGADYFSVSHKVHIDNKINLCEKRLNNFINDIESYGFWKRLYFLITGKI